MVEKGEREAQQNTILTEICGMIEGKSSMTLQIYIAEREEGLLREGRVTISKPLPLKMECTL